MRKLNIGIPMIVLGLMLCFALSAQPPSYNVSGTVYFDNAETEPAPCSWVQLYSGSGCIHPDSLVDSQVADEDGQYSFNPLPGGSYSVVTRWAVVFCTDCDTAGSDCGTRFDSDCKNVDTSSGNQVVNLNYDDIDCICQ
jgi:hypothetical protein